MIFLIFTKIYLKETRKSMKAAILEMAAKSH